MYHVEEHHSHNVNNIHLDSMVHMDMQSSIDVVNIVYKLLMVQDFELHSDPSLDIDTLLDYLDDYTNSRSNGHN